MEPRFNFGKKEEADYNPYGKTFTERQKLIIWGFPVDKLRLQEIIIIMRKAEKMGLPSLCKRVYDTYEELLQVKVHQNTLLKKLKSSSKNLHRGNNK